MSVISNNSSDSPMDLGGAMIQSPVVLKSIQPGTFVSSNPQKSVTDSNSKTPYIYYKENPKGLNSSSGSFQVMGLVPVFACCDEVQAKAIFVYDVSQCPGGIGDFKITINGVDYGDFGITSSMSASDVVSYISASLPPGEFVVTCYKMSNTVGVVTFTYTSGGASNNGVSFLVTVVPYECGQIRQFSGGNVFSGGIDAASDCSFDCDCREGKYTADEIPNDKNFTLPVFATTEEDCDDLYHNDYNTFVFNYPLSYDAIANGDFILQQYLPNMYYENEWQDVATLDDDSFGIVIQKDCLNLNYQGYQLRWSNVLSEFGSGTFRFRVFQEGDYCFNSPPFCLQSFGCVKADGTVKFETFYQGGTFGSPIVQGLKQSLCCAKDLNVKQAITITDSIRFAGFFGRENYEKQRDQIKYATGEIKRVRDEAVKTFDLRTDRLPFWLHQRLATYGMMADKIFVSDYNINNASYNYKHFWVVDDSGYEIDYKNYTRYDKIKPLKFKEGRQFVYKDRCC